MSFDEVFYLFLRGLFHIFFSITTKTLVYCFFLDFFFFVKNGAIELRFRLLSEIRNFNIFLLKILLEMQEFL